MANIYEDFNLQLLGNYKGNNPYINTLRKKYLSNPNYKPNVFENEYLIKNFRFEEYKFDLLTTDIGEKTKEKLKKDFNIEEVKPQAQLDSIVGETDEWYHVCCTVKNNKKVYFWVSKEEVGDLYKQNYTRFPVDFDLLNKYFKHTLYDWQESGVQFLLYNKKCFLLDGMGSGKTHTSIAATIQHCEKVLIICIHGKQIDWKNELHKWGQKSKIIWTGKKGWDNSNVKYTIIGNHVLHKFHEFKTKKKKASELYQPLMDEKYDCIIIDEMQYFKSTNSKRSKVLAELCAQDNVKYTWALSGTLIEKNSEFYDVCRNMSLSISNVIKSAKDYSYFEWNPAYEEYAKVYCDGFKIQPKKGKGYWVKRGNTNTHELHQRVKHVIRRVHVHKERSDFPEKWEDQLFFMLTTRERNQYDSLYKDYLMSMGFWDEFAKMEKSVLALEDKLEKAIERQNWNTVEKLRRKLEKEENDAIEFYDKWINLENLIGASLMRQFLAIKKVPHTINFIKSEIEMGKNTLIFTNFIDELELLEKHLGKYAVVIHGGLPAGKKQELIDEYMNNPDKPLLIGNSGSIGTGYNITKADNIYFNSLPWSSDVVEQGIARSWRLGREEDVEVFYPTFEDTFEEEVYRIVRSKSKNRQVFQGDTQLNDD
jgi:SNF2 family DNA or RNA helicase